MGDLATVEQGNARGVSDGTLAAKCAIQLGAPPTTPIFAAVDFDAAGSQEIGDIDQYMDGFAIGCSPYPQGDYGDGAVLSSMPHSLGFLAGADGWSGTEAYIASGAAALVQHASTTLFGIDVDPVDVIDESVLWFPKATAVTSPLIPPIATAMPSLAALQSGLNANGASLAVDGIWGPATAAAMAAYYERQ
jgi:hypothetical protein